MGRANQPAIDAIGPGVIRALDGLGELPGAFTADSRSTMATHIEEGTQLSIAPTNDDDRLVSDIAHDEGPRARHRAHAADAVPHARKELCPLFIENRGRCVVLAGHG